MVLAMFHFVQNAFVILRTQKEASTASSFLVAVDYRTEMQMRKISNYWRPRQPSQCKCGAGG